MREVVPPTPRSVAKFEHAVEPPIAHHEVNTPRSWLNLVAYGVLILASAIVSVLVYWSLQRGPVLEMNTAIHVVRPPLKLSAGNDFLAVNFDYCKLIGADGTVRTSFVSDKTEIFLPAATDHSPKLCSTVQVPVSIPPQLVPDTYRIKYHVVYQINPVRSSTEDYYSEPFEVTP